MGRSGPSFQPVGITFSDRKTPPPGFPRRMIIAAQYVDSSSCRSEVCSASPWLGTRVAAALGALLVGARGRPRLPRARGSPAEGRDGGSGSASWRACAASRLSWRGRPTSRASRGRCSTRSARCSESDFVALAFVSEDGSEASRLSRPRRTARTSSGGGTCRVDLVREPSGIASGGPRERRGSPSTTSTGSTRVASRLAPESGAKSAAYMPLISADRVIAVISVATTEEQRAFSPDELR